MVRKNKFLFAIHLGAVCNAFITVAYFQACTHTHSEGNTQTHVTTNAHVPIHSQIGVGIAWQWWCITRSGNLQQNKLAATKTTVATATMFILIKMPTPKNSYCAAFFLVTPPLKMHLEQLQRKKNLPELITFCQLHIRSAVADSYLFPPFFVRLARINVNNWYVCILYGIRLFSQKNIYSLGLWIISKRVVH